MKNLNNWQKEFEKCCYAKKLLDKITYLNSIATTPLVNTKKVKKAIYYARKYHGNQVRQSGEPFYSHPIEVAIMVADYLFRTDIIVTSILHDTIEDTELTEEAIAHIFGNKIASQVQDLTRIKPEGKISSGKMVEILYIEKKYDLLLIKLLDRLHNMQTISAKSPEKIEKIVEETINKFIVLSIALRLDDIEQMLKRICIKTKQNAPSTLQDQIMNFDDYFQLPVLNAQNSLFPK